MGGRIVSIQPLTLEGNSQAKSEATAVNQNLEAEGKNKATGADLNIEAETKPKAKQSES